MNPLQERYSRVGVTHPAHRERPAQSHLRAGRERPSAGGEGHAEMEEVAEGLAQLGQRDRFTSDQQLVV